MTIRNYFRTKTTILVFADIFNAVNLAVWMTTSFSLPIGERFSYVSNQHLEEEKEEDGGGGEGRRKRWD